MTVRRCSGKAICVAAIDCGNGTGTRPSRVSSNDGDVSSNGADESAVPPARAGARPPGGLGGAPDAPWSSGLSPMRKAELRRLKMKTTSLRLNVFAGCLLAASPLLIVGCGGATQTSSQVADGSSPSSQSDAGQQPSSQSDGGQIQPVDGSVANGCNLPARTADICSALPIGKLSPCSQDGGQPSQTGYLEIDSPDSSPVYVCATSWSSEPSVGYVFGEPATFLSDAQSCCGGTVSATAAPTVPESSLGSLGAPHVPSHIKPQEMEQPGSGTIRQDPFAVVVTDMKSGAAAIQAISTWLSWGGDGKPHPAPDGTGRVLFRGRLSHQLCGSRDQRRVPRDCHRTRGLAEGRWNRPHSGIRRLACAQRVAAPLSP